MKTYRITAVWRDTVTVELDDDDVELTNDISTWPDSVAGQMMAQGAELVDWDVRAVR